MKLISTLLSKKALSIVALMMFVTYTYAGISSSFDSKRVYWNKFEADVTSDNMVVLTWNVTEYNNKNFSVQHSVNGTDWEDIGFIESQKSAESMTDYSYQHKSNYQGRQFYRLKAFDTDNRSKSVSPVVTVTLKSDKQGISLWPNPATNHILISNGDKGDIYTKASILDLSGKMMIESELKPNLTEIAVDNLLTGIYIVVLENKNGTKETQRFIKQ